MKNAIKNKLVKNKEKKMNKEYFNERTERLHFEITTNLLDRDYVREKANEIFERLPKTDDEFEFLGITEKNIEHYKKNNNPEQLEIPEEMKAYSIIVADYCLLYQIFILLQDKNKQDEVLKLICKITKLLFSKDDEVDEVVKEIYENPSMFIMQNLLTFLSDPNEKTNMDRIALFYYCFQKDDDYDKWVDSEIEEIIKAYFSHNHEPRDLFHTDHDYIQDYLANCLFTEEKINEIKEKYDPISEFIETSRCMLDPEALSTISPEEKNIMFKKTKRKIQNLETMYSFRVMYPRESYTNKKKFVYEREMDLYDRVLFNKIKIFSNKLTDTRYLEPEDFINVFKNVIIKEQPLTKAVYMALYLAIKEMGWIQFQLVFPKIKNDDQKNYNINNLMFFGDFINNAKIGQHFKATVLNEIKKTMKEEENNIQTMSQTDKTFLKGLLFVCMWEKSSYRKRFDQDTEKIYKQDNTKKNPNEIMNEVVDYRSGDNIHRLFKKATIENLHKVLKEATKLLEMSESGLDFSKFKFDDNFIYSEDIIFILYNFSRIERESIPNIINIINLLRERQKNILPIGSGKSYKKENQNKLKYIDIGFNIPHFKRKLPELKNIKSLQWAGWNGHLIVTPVTCKFICETDRILSEKGEIDYIANNKKAINTTYLYKIRNQATHYSSDESIGHLLKPEKIRQLIIILLEANKKYNSIYNEIHRDWINEGVAKTMLETRPLRVIAPSYIVKKIEKLIQVLSMLLLTINKDKLSSEEKKVFQFMLDENIEESLKNLEAYILEQEELDKEGIKLDSDNYKNILSDEQMKEFPYINENIEYILNFIFASHTANYAERTQYDDFLKTYHGESSFYLLYLLQHFGDVLKDN